MQNTVTKVKGPKLRVPKQKRSKETKAHIMRVARQLFSETGYHKVNSNQIADKAGVSVGTFYSYFKDKKELLLEIIHTFFDRFWEKAHREAEKKLPDLRDFKEDLHSLIETSLSEINVNPAFYRMMFSLQFYDPDIRQVFEEVKKRERDRILNIYNLSGDRIKVRDKEAAATITLNFIEYVALSGLRLERERVVNEITDMVYYYFTQKRHAE
jgi:AcrR family transcriptional regulator